jgi:hypothetical protein
MKLAKACGVGRPSAEIITGRQAIQSPEISDKWRQSVSASTNLRIAQQTPEWLEYQSDYTGGFGLCVARNAAGEIIGLTPFIKTDWSLKFSVRNTALYACKLGSITLAGNAPLTSTEPDALPLLFRTLADETRYNAIVLPGVALTSDFRASLDRLTSSPDSPWFLYQPWPLDRYHCIQMPESFDAYMAKFDAKARYNLNREVRLLKKRGGDSLELERIDRPEQIRAFLEEAGMVAANSWKRFLVGRPLDQSADRLTFLTSMASQGTLRSYVLKCGGVPCAYVIGFQMNGIFHFFETSYDEQWSTFSAGKVNLFLIVKDMFAHNTPRVFYLGTGGASYKNWFQNSMDFEATLLILRKTAINRLRVAAHRGFRSLIGSAKNVLAKDRPSASAATGSLVT